MTKWFTDSFIWSACESFLRALKIECLRLDFPLEKWTLGLSILQACRPGSLNNSTFQDDKRIIKPIHMESLSIVTGLAWIQ